MIDRHSFKSQMFKILFLERIIGQRIYIMEEIVEQRYTPARREWGN